MAVVIQPLVGRRHGDYLYPDVAGVARSYDYYPMRDLRAEDGVASVALGLGRIVVEGGALRALLVRRSRARLYQFSSSDDYLENSQREFYALDLSTARAGRRSADDEPDANLARLTIEVAERHGTLAAVGSVYSPDNDAVYDGIHRPGVRIVTMAGFLSGDHFPLPPALRFLWTSGKAGFSCHVEIEFAARLRANANEPHELAFLQIRPLVLGPDRRGDPTGRHRPRAGDLRLGPRARAWPARGHPRSGLCPGRDLRAQAHRRRSRAEIGHLNNQLQAGGTALSAHRPGTVGERRPVARHPGALVQISNARCIVEAPLADMHVEPSQGSHFFQNITSFGLGYFTLGSEGANDFLDAAWLDAQAAHAASAHVRHLRFDAPLEVVVDGRHGLGVVMKPGRRVVGG